MLKTKQKGGSYRPRSKWSTITVDIFVLRGARRIGKGIEWCETHDHGMAYCTFSEFHSGPYTLVFAAVLCSVYL